MPGPRRRAFRPARSCAASSPHNRWPAPPKTRNIRETPKERHPLDQLMLNHRTRVTVKMGEGDRVLGSPNGSPAGEFPRERRGGYHDQCDTNSGSREGLMVDRWFFGDRAPISFEQFEKLPTNPAYKYEYFERQGVAHAPAEGVPRPARAPAREGRSRSARPPRKSRSGSARWRPPTGMGWTCYSRGRFDRIQPFASLSDPQRLEAARQCLRFTRDGGDGPLIEPACFVAVASGGQSSERERSW